MKVRLSILLVLIMVLGFNANLYAYNYQSLENYISYRIKYIHNIAHNGNITLSKVRVREYAKDIIYWSDYYSRELQVNIDPLLVTAILETETNFVSREDYDSGASIGIASMRIDTAKWIAKRININYNKWDVLDPTGLGIRFAVYYLGLAYNKYNGDIDKIIVSYNQGFAKASSKDLDQLYNNYLFKVLGRYNYYQQRIRSYDSTIDNYFAYKLAKLD
ncbi:soluble lytic murein transglycosylase [Orenia metallireducens]|uniref:Soluble lytic murein transglycosylase n=1 Tax=Orenia metallireducens TaxID=1413210 RepID=A0A285HF58_9FIRM|nr:transglycosylase SLT domain-containing protein [Orenia metallireducens]PRX27425.1 soluble lytic murein transglycosylase [Orenia metallireducens]SNY34360.1 soluble lytic murein transglycosylase [Orenia metallireducens]